MNALRLAGHAMLWSGFLTGTFFAVQSAEVADAPWSTIAWPRYLAALIVGIIGVVALRVSQHQHSTHADKLDADIQVLHQRVSGLLKHLNQMHKQRRAIAVHDVRHLIDERLAAPLADFAEARGTLVHTYGLQKYARVMTDFAVAERNINRAWSASADGYVDEVWASLQRATERLETVGQRLLEYQSEAVD